ncbi:MAG: flagellar M-ring protein FliF, partial [Lachnospiraceae bacterium]|nr:flagellar M-ring protein FliF [Lachnospiraceae bacterium]
TTENITILDMDANLLFSGDDSSTVYGTASSQLGVKKEAEDLVNSSVKKILQGTGEFGDIKVSSSLVIDFSTNQKTTHNYTPAEGQSQGVLSEESSYNSESSGGTSGVPGTDSNTETSYQYNTNDYSSETIEELYRKYLPNEYIEYQDIPAGVIDYRASSLAVSSTNYVVINEDDAKKQGLLEGITWEEYQAANSERRVVPVSDELISAASDASGIPEDNITIVAYEENFFVDSEGLNIDIYDLIQVILIVIILGLLAVVVLRSMRTEKQEEETEELSVETLLQSNPEPQLDDIELEENSETKKLIEKFVDENPEAVANLLRNWLSEEWG